MKKCSTSDIPTLPGAGKKAQSSSAMRPGKSAIEFIRQFARSYHFEPRLASLGSMSIN